MGIATTASGIVSTAMGEYKQVGIGQLLWVRNTSKWMTSTAMGIKQLQVGMVQLLWVWHNSKWICINRSSVGIHTTSAEDYCIICYWGSQ
jgi:hypothetical protein